MCAIITPVCIVCLLLHSILSSVAKTLVLLNGRSERRNSDMTDYTQVVRKPVFLLWNYAFLNTIGIVAIQKLCFRITFSVFISQFIHFLTLLLFLSSCFFFLSIYALCFSIFITLTKKEKKKLRMKIIFTSILISNSYFYEFAAVKY